MFYFGKSTVGNVYCFDLNKDTFRECVKVSDEDFEKINEEINSENKILSADKDGNPILVDFPKPTEEESKKQRISELELYLSQTDWYAIRFADTGEPIPVEIKQKRQDARDEISALRNE